MLIQPGSLSSTVFLQPASLLQAAVAERKKAMKQKLIQKQKEKLGDVEKEAQERSQYLLQRANRMRLEQEDEIKELSKVGHRHSAVQPALSPAHLLLLPLCPKAPSERQVTGAPASVGFGDGLNQSKQGMDHGHMQRCLGWILVQRGAGGAVSLAQGFQSPQRALW